VLGEGLYQFQAECVPAGDSLFGGAVSDIEQELFRAIYDDRDA
jgi:hypothetical protein